ncbi:HAD family hydrolase [Cytobacillus praedii]|uniref:HAD family hydrolase n=1 Tax=Cytobacillus praedii TaxID=1742358 RepID=A0A4V2NUC3_9BACI|nr:HAD family hydrolase [Cytobacillus praedii]TCJ03843.1 HAD family hydrolase [Cytobacillus praedii]
MIKAVLFDLDGTLLNRDASLKYFLEAQYERLYQYLGHIPIEKYTSRFIELDQRGYVGKDLVYQQLIIELNISGISRESLHQDYINEFSNCCVPFPNLINMLESLKDRSILLGIITNGKGKFQMDNIKALGIENYFDTILISEREGIKKPNPEIFKRALSKLDAAAYESMYVGDHPENDVLGSKKFGMSAVWKKDIYWGHAEADFVINDLMDLLKIVESQKGRTY